MAGTTVRVGDRDLTVAEFSAFKFLEATELLGRMLEVVPDLDDEMTRFAHAWREQHPPRTFDRAAAEYELGPRVGVISDEAWEATGQKVTLTANTDGLQTAIRLAPKVYRHARRDFENLVALVVTPNSELEEADAAGASLYDDSGCVERQRRFIVHHGRPGQMVKLGLVAFEALAEELREGDLSDAVGKLVARWTDMTSSKPTTGDKREPTGEKGEKPRPGKGARRSSTSSSPRTPAGSTAGKSSTESPTGS